MSVCIYLVSLLFTAVEHSLEAPVTDTSNIVVNVDVDCESTTTEASSMDKVGYWRKERSCSKCFVQGDAGGCMQYS